MKVLLESKKKFIITVIAYYAIVTLIVMFKLTHYTYDMFGNKQEFGLNDMVLDTSPYFQRFDGYNVMGVRLYLTNEDQVHDGNVYVIIGSYDIGEVLLKAQIKASDIGSDYNGYIDVVSDKVLTKDSTKLYYSIFTDKELSGKIKTKFYGHPKNSEYLLHVGKPLAGYSEKTMSYNTLQRRIPFSFIVWIFLTSVLVMAVVCCISRAPATPPFLEEIRIEDGLQCRLLLIVLITVGLFGTGIIKPSTFYIDTISTDIQDDRLVDGYVLQEKTVTNFTFTTISDELKNIRIKLGSYPSDLAEYTIVLSDKDDDYIADVFSSDMDFDGTWLIWDVSEYEFEENAEYKLDVFFPLKGEKPAPEFMRITCDYGEEGVVSKKKVAIGIAVFCLLSLLMVLVKIRK